MGPQEREIELYDYLEVILRRKWYILAGALLCVAGTSIYTSSALPLYQASAQIFIVPPQTELKETQVELFTLTPAFYQAVATADENVLAMNQLQQSLIDSLGLSLPQTPLSLEAEVVDNMRMVMRVSAADTLLARQILYAWIETFLDQNQALSATESKRYFNDVLAQYEQARDKLAEVDGALAELSGRTMLGVVEKQQVQYQKQLLAAQDSLVSAEFELREKESRREHIREAMQGMEQGGRPIYTLSAVEHAPLKANQLSPLAHRVLDCVSALDTLKKAQDQAEAQYNLALLEFDQGHNYNGLSRKVEEVAKAIESYQRSYIQAQSQQLTANANLQAIEKELAKHPEVIGDGPGLSELNPVRLELEKQRAEEGVSYEMARVYAERGQVELQEMQARHEAARRELYSVEKERQVLANRLARERAAVREQIDFYQATFDAARKAFLGYKMEVSVVEGEVGAKKLLTQYRRDHLHQLEQTIKGLQQDMAAEIAESERLNRERKTYTATFDRFAQLVEEARIAQQKAAKSVTNLRLITRDVMARPVGSAGQTQKIPMSAGLGALLSTVLVFLAEYIRKAREQRAAAGQDQGN